MRDRRPVRPPRSAREYGSTRPVGFFRRFPADDSAAAECTKSETHPLVRLLDGTRDGTGVVRTTDDVPAAVSIVVVRFTKYASIATVLPDVGRTISAHGYRRPTGLTNQLKNSVFLKKISL